MAAFGFSQPQEMSRSQVAKIGKAATVFIEVKTPRGPSSGSGFCVHESGLFITNEHVIADATSIKVVLNSGQRDQKVLPASVVRRDKDADLALLQTDPQKGLPTLMLGAVDKLSELDNVIAFGFPLGQLLAEGKNNYPAMSINSGSISSLRNKDGDLDRIQLDVELNPGNSGGPLLDMHGKVIGVVVSGIRTTRINFAIPASRVEKFVATPTIVFSPPDIDRDNMHKEVVFEATVTTVLPNTRPIEMDLVFDRNGTETKYKMEPSQGVYRVALVPMPAKEGPIPLRVTAKLGKNIIASPVADQTIKVDDKDVKLSDIRMIEFEAQPRIVFVDGKEVRAPIAGVGALELEIGKAKLKLEELGPESLLIDNLLAASSLSWKVIARQNGKELKQLSGSVNLGGAAAVAIQSPVLDKDKMTLRLPHAATSVAVGGAGRYLILHVPEESALLVFDVNAAMIVKSIRVGQEKFGFAAGMDRLMIVKGNTGDLTVERWSLITFQREASAPLTLKVPLITVAMGSASQGPLLVEGVNYPVLGECAFFDIHTMTRMDFAIETHNFFETSPQAWLRASADGRVFVNQNNQNGGTIQSCVREGDDWKRYRGGAGSRPVPSPDGKFIYTDSGQFDEQLKPAGGSGSRGLPSTHGNYYVAAVPGGQQVKIYRARQLEPITSVVVHTSLEVSKAKPGGKKASSAMSIEQRIHLIPNASLLVYISENGKELILHRVKLKE
jgi:S1-C subfamily serine protease